MFFCFTSVIVLTLITITFLSHVLCYISIDEISWNSFQTDWKRYQVMLCGRECRNGILVTMGRQCSLPMCFPCTCGRRCAQFGTCCPSFDSDTDSYNYAMNTSREVKLQWHERLNCWKPPLSRHGYFTVVKCPSSWRDQEVKEKCENPTSDSMSSVTPFSEKTTGLVFPNAYCALCNGFQLPAKNTSDDKPTVYPWSITINCLHYQNLYQITDKFKFYQETSAREECVVTFDPPFWNSMPCNTRFNTFPPQTVCTAQDPTAENLCHTLPPYLSLTVGGYRNVFCAICSGLAPKKHRCQSSLPAGITNEVATVYNRLPPMYLLFSLKLRDGMVAVKFEESEKCTSGFWRDNEDDCAPSACTPGKIMNNKTCETAIPDIRGLEYNISLVLVPQSYINAYAIKSLLVTIESRLMGANSFFDIFTQVFTEHCHVGDHRVSKLKKRLLGFKMTGYINAPPSMSRDEFEKGYIESLLTDPWNLTIPNYFDAGLDNVSFSVACIGREMCHLYQTIPPMNNNFTWSNTSPPYAVTDRVGCFTHVQHTSVIGTKSYGYNNKTIDINPSLTCPFIAVNLTSQPTIENGSILFSILFRNQEINVAFDRRLSLLNGKLLVCQDFIQELLEKLVDDNEVHSYIMTTNTLMAISYYIEMICLILSVMCLLASVITYCLFQSLRCLPGLNNMCLCLSLATAQVSLLIISADGARVRMHAIHCLIHAVIVHYSWLSTFCWMNTCCIHMFRVFTSTQSPGTRYSERKTHRHYCIYSFGIPALTVVVNVTITSVLTQGNSIGYDAKVCFLDASTSNLIPILGLITPFCVTMVINFALFCLTVKEIMLVTRLQPSSNSRSSQGVITYIKLSTLTGFFCAVAAAAVLSKNPILSFLTGPLAALQGLFIFVSFTCTKHVRELYKKWILERSHGESSSSATHTGSNRKISTKLTKI